MVKGTVLLKKSSSVPAAARSEEKKRLVTPEELFLSMGLPSSGAIVEPLWVVWALVTLVALRL